MTKRRTKCPICYEYRIDGPEHRASERHSMAVTKMRQIIEQEKARRKEQR